MRVPEYFWFDPFNPDDWAGFSIQQGVYQPLVANERNQLVSQSLGLGLQRWQGKYRGVETVWLRWATLDGELLPTAAEIAQQEQQSAEAEHQRAEAEHQRAEAEHQRAEAEHQRAEAEHQRAEQMQSQLQQTVRNLLQTGMTVEQVARFTGLDVSQVEELGDR
ncbi:hypothetical protein SAMD00079811_57070 [Scytonema sp. HK-05]|nr:hypothetical protein SAMD00079811_57070 [Scytonema sp. HK-05]